MDPILLAIAVPVALLTVVIVVMVFTTAESRATGKESLRAIESYTWQDDQLVAKELPFFDRVLGPLSGKLVQLGKRFTPIGYVEGRRVKLIHAGRRGPDELDKFLAQRVLTIGAIPLLFILMFALLPLPTKQAFYMFLLLAVSLGLGPDAILNRQVDARKKLVRRQLPDVLDLLTISVEAGLGFEQAIDRITETVPGPLSDEFSRMIGEMRAGASRSEALQGVEVRTGVDEVKSFVMSMVQADAFGVSIGRVLRSQADEMRIKRRQLAQEAAQKAPVKMLIPMTFLIFPALFVVILGPAMINIVQNLK
jgi:tight adherence protein C